MIEHKNIIIASEESLSIHKAVSRLKEALALFDYTGALSDALDQNLLVTFSQPVSAPLYEFVNRLLLIMFSCLSEQLLKLPYTDFG